MFCTSFAGSVFALLWAVLQQPSPRSLSRRRLLSLPSLRVLCLAASLALFVVTLSTIAQAYDTGESAGLSGSVQEPGAMMLTGLALLGLAFAARQMSGKNRPGSADQ